jgi:hypothetical protein
MLKSTKAAIEEGFDIGIMPEGQPNPMPEDGLQPIFSGAFTLAKMSRRPKKDDCTVWTASNVAP